MKKLLFFALTLLVTSVAFISCNKDEDPNYTKSIIGTWTVTSQDTIVVPESATSTFETAMSLALAAGFDLNSSVTVEQSRAPMLAPAEDEPYGVIFSVTGYRLFQGTDIDTEESLYTLSGNKLTLKDSEDSAYDQVLTILDMNNQTATLESTFITMDDIESGYNEEKANLSLDKQMAVEFMIQSLKADGFEKVLIRLHVTKSATE